jgi:FkbM family methyltransferase
LIQQLLKQNMIGKRRLSEVFAAVLQRQHYRALFNMWRLYPKFVDNFWRYASGQGSYPHTIEVRTPIGIISILLHSYHDILTVNEIFCRQDYPAHPNVRNVVDLGSNIGVSALFFLTRNTDSQCILYEPDPRNITKLKQNLAGFEHRYTLIEAAVADRSGQIEFGIEATGRYGGINRQSKERINVKCVHIEDALNEAFQSLPHIDILKIDIEGEELRAFAAISDINLRRIRRIYLEVAPQESIRSELFINRQYGSICQLISKNAP